MSETKTIENDGRHIIVDYPISEKPATEAAKSMSSRIDENEAIDNGFVLPTSDFRLVADNLRAGGFSDDVVKMVLQTARLNSGKNNDAIGVSQVFEID